MSTRHRRQQVLLDAPRDLDVLLQARLLERVGVQSRVLDGDRQLRRDRSEQGQVARRELAAHGARVDVDDADGAVPGPHRRAHHGAQLEVVDRLAEFERFLVGLHDRTHGDALFEASPHEAAAPLQVTLERTTFLVLGDSHRQVVRRIAEQQDRPLGPGHLQGPVDDVAQHPVEVDVGRHRGDRVEQDLQRTGVLGGVAGEQRRLVT
jgi:hypothetical protein